MAWKFATMEGHPAVYSDREAFWRPDRKWMAIPAAEIMMHAKALTRDQFVHRFGAAAVDSAPVQTFKASQ